MAAPTETAPVGDFDDTDRASLLDTCREGHARAGRDGRPVLVSWAKPLPAVDPMAVWRRARPLTRRSLLWRSAWDQGCVVALDTAHELPGRGAARVQSVRFAWARLSRDLVHGGTADPAQPSGDGPLAIGGFAFSPDGTGPEGRLPDTLVWVPAFQLRSRAADAGDRPGPAELRLNAVLTRDDDPEQTAKELGRIAELYLAAEDEPGVPSTPTARRTWHSTEKPAAEDWRDLVRRATGRIRAGDFEKVVLAREVQVTASAAFDIPAAADRLLAANPGTTVFAVGHDEYTFLGATPEYLVRVEGRDVHALGLAGTTPRGGTPEEDAARERELVGSAKIQHEHDVVVQMLRDALADGCVEVTAETPPRVVKLAHVQHLSTKVRGRLGADSGTGILDFVEGLHPTPALGGQPRREALSWLTENEGFDRGWYAGVVGWADPSGQGQFAVAIRSALLAGASASLYAGCGLVADSDPAVEYAETCAKLRPMLSALEIE
ncbi:isochorismate synthase MenF [Streptomyces sp. NPDC101165]|uniref:isochorismate synthase n=1 Tax=Streptomyces sp. NPDC101165 TaxID=3366119 RepID=UPI00382980D3